MHRLFLRAESVQALQVFIHGGRHGFGILHRFHHGTGTQHHVAAGKDARAAGVAGFIGGQKAVIGGVQAGVVFTILSFGPWLTAMITLSAEKRAGSPMAVTWPFSSKVACRYSTPASVMRSLWMP